MPLVARFPSCRPGIRIGWLFNRAPVSTSVRGFGVGGSRAVSMTPGKQRDKYEPPPVVTLSNSGDGPLKVPGFGLPISFEYENWLQVDSFEGGPSVNRCPAPRMTRREIAMLRFMDAITENPDWSRNVYDDSVVDRWRQEAKAHPDQMISDATFGWCIQELKDRAKQFEANGSAWIGALECSARVVKADGLFSPALQADLRRAVQPLVESKSQSVNQIVELVDPSLHPLVYGRTRVITEGGVASLQNCLTSCGQGEVSRADQEVESFEERWGMRPLRASLWSQRFQWLPAEVEFEGKHGPKVKITSYINNLYPFEHGDLYKIIEQVVSDAIPLWNYTLQRGFRDRVSLRIMANEAEAKPPPPKLRYESADNPKETRQKAYDYLALPDNPAYYSVEDELECFVRDEGLPDNWATSDETDLYQLLGAVEYKYYRIRKILHPEPGDYVEWKQENDPNHHTNGRQWREFKIEDDFRERGLQIFVKLSSIELSPSAPMYDGEIWHFEGLRNEHVVGNLIYCFDSSNVTDSKVRFRNEATLEDRALKYDKADPAPLAEIYGNEWLQDIGGVTIKKGRALAFPNTLQYKLEPFELINKTKPGYMRFLVVCLVDPTYRIVSTRNVPPQQKEWYLKELRKTGGKTPLFDRSKNVEVGLIDIDETRRWKLELTNERVAVNDAIEDWFAIYGVWDF